MTEGPGPVHTRTGALGETTAGRLAALLLRADLPDVTDEELDLAVAHVRRSVAAMPSANRAAVSAAALMVVALLSGFARTWVWRAPASRQSDAVARLSTLPAPGVSEFVKLTRGLALVAVHEARTHGTMQ